MRSDIQENKDFTNSKRDRRRRATALLLLFVMLMSVGTVSFVLGAEGGGTPEPEPTPEPCTHEWSNWVVVKKNTYFEKGLKKHTCKECGAVEKKVIPKKIAKRKWIWHNKRLYYFNRYGKTVKGWHKIKSGNTPGSQVRWCYFDKKCRFVKGFSRFTKNKWVKVNGINYYFTPKGRPVMGGTPYLNWKYGTYVLVDLSDQTFRYYKKKKLILSGHVVTGTSDSPTPKGVYRVTNKAKNATLVGPTWNRKVKRWIGFIGHEYGLHDASWQKDKYFDDPNAHFEHGSHGCVNMRKADILELYDYVKVGTRVIIRK